MVPRNLILLLVFAHVAVCVPKPQLITFRDGKIGVNFLGYHAEAGLGGLLTGNAAHGGLSASAGTPFGQRAGAGLGGTVDGQGRTVGGLYAGASANSEVGASAALGGNLDGSGGYGGKGAEAHAYGQSSKTLQLAQTPVLSAPVHHDERTFVKEKEIIREHGTDVRTNVQTSVQTAAQAPVHIPAQAPVQNTIYSKRVYKKKLRNQHRHRPHNKVRVHSSEESSEEHRGNSGVGARAGLGGAIGAGAFAGAGSHVAAGSDASSSSTTYTKTRQWNSGQAGQAGPTVYDDIFNIPISVLGAVNQLLNNKAAGGGATVTKTKTVEVQHS